MNQMNLFTPATVENNMMAFALREAHRMWPKEQHRQRSLAQLATLLPHTTFLFQKGFLSLTKT